LRSENGSGILYIASDSKASEQFYFFDAKARFLSLGNKLDPVPRNLLFIPGNKEENAEERYKYNNDKYCQKITSNYTIIIIMQMRCPEKRKGDTHGCVY
jgi:hypothetical protein